MSYLVNPKLRIIILLLLVLVSSCLHAQTKVYYNQAGEITIAELANHYRIAKVDTAKRIFVGIVKEFRLDSTQFLEASYDSVGLIIDLTVFRNTRSEIESFIFQTIPDSLEENFKNKSKFIQAKYIRKNDYPDLKPMLVANKRKLDVKKSNGSEDEFTIVESHPYFEGGMKNLIFFLGKHLFYPEEARLNKVNGSVNVAFTIMPDGTLSKIKAVNKLGFGCDEAAEYAVSKLPDWEPGYQNGRAVSVRMALPVAFE